VASDAVVAWAYHVEVCASAAKLGLRTRSIRPFLASSEWTGSSSSTTITTGIRGFAAACAGSAIEPAASSAASAAVALT
jgi:hypothetical protein